MLASERRIAFVRRIFSSKSDVPNSAESAKYGIEFTICGLVAVTSHSRIEFPIVYLFGRLISDADVKKGMNVEFESGICIEELSPRKVWEELSADSNSVLVDVRTRPEWAFVGFPDLSEIGRRPVFVEWQVYPDMKINRNFVEEMKSGLNEAVPKNLYFICRSGVRSRAAAACILEHAAVENWPIRCVNVSQGFEGVPDSDRRRGNLNGWKHSGLPWHQS